VGEHERTRDKTGGQIRQNPHESVAVNPTVSAISFLHSFVLSFSSYKSFRTPSLCLSYLRIHLHPAENRSALPSSSLQSTWSSHHLQVIWTLCAFYFWFYNSQLSPYLSHHASAPSSPIRDLFKTS
jgi:hypothetical protein